MPSKTKQQPKLHSKKSSIMEIEDPQLVAKKSSKKIVKPSSKTVIDVK